MLTIRLLHVCAGLACLASRHVRRRRSILTTVVRALVTMSVLAGLLSCAAYRAAAPDDPRLAQDAAQPRVRVAGYITSDGSYHRFDGHLTQTADSLVFVRSSSGARLTATASPERVQSVRLEQGVSAPRTVLFGLSLLAFLALGWALVGGPLIDHPPLVA
jgi:hypothetical protein